MSIYDDPKQAVERADKVVNKGFMGWITRLFMGKNFVNKANEGLNLAKQAMAEPERRAQLEMTGVKTSGTILKIEDTGKMINYNPVARLTLQLENPGREVVTEQILSKLAIPRPGDTVTVHYDPANPNDIVIS